MPRLLILMLTRTYRAEAFMRAATRLGVEVTVGTEIEQVLQTPGSALALDFADERRLKQQVRAFAEQYPVDAVVGVDDDVTVAAALAAEALGLPHNRVDAVKAARYKDVLRLALSETEGLLSPAFDLVAVDEDPRKAAARLPYPCVVKPLALSASRGVIRADTPEAFVAAFREVVEILAETDLPPDDPGRQQVLVEGFIPGREVALEGLLRDGALAVLALFDKPDPLDGPYFEETLYVTPSHLPEQLQRQVADTVARATEALGLREGPIHAEARINEAGVWIVEVAPRTIGGQCSDVLRFDEDLSLEEIALRQAAGLPIPSTRREDRAAGVMMIPIPRAGTLCDVRGLAEARAVPGVERVTISLRAGDRVVPLPRATKYLGFIFARGETPAAVETALRTAHARLTFEIT